MLNISVTSDLERQVSQWARIAGDQVPFATALALTRTAKAAKEEIERQLPSLIDKPTAYTMRGFRLYPATKKKLIAEVTFRDAFGKGTAARDYLSPLVYGGDRKLKAFERSLQKTGLLPAGYAAMPGKAAEIDGFGNMSRGQIVQILSYFKAFGEQGYRANITDKKRDAMAAGNKRNRGVSYFVGRPGNGKLPLGVWKKTSFGGLGSSVKPIIIFTKKPRYAARLNVPGIAQRIVEARFPVELEAAVKQALATRR